MLRINHWLDHVLPRSKNIEKFVTAFSFDSERVYDRGSKDDSEYGKWTAGSTHQFLNHVIDVSVTPNAEFFKFNRDFTAEWLSSFALLLGLLSTVLVYMTLRTKAAQEAVVAARDRLEVRVQERTADLEETQATYGWAAEIGKLGHYVWDEIDNQCVYCSPQLAQMYGLTPEQYIESSKSHNQNAELVHPDDLAAFTTITQDIEKDLEFVSRVLREDGSVSFLQEYGRRIRDESGRVIQTNGIIRDVTEDKNKEAALQNALANAELANLAKSEFLATMSHELRTPLNAILGFSDILSEQYFGPPGAGKYREYAKDIHHSGEHLLELVNELLDISTIEAGKSSIEKELVSIVETVEDCARTIDAKLHVKDINLSSTISNDLPLLYADRRAVKQILLNLLSNAAKFTFDGGHISISVEAERQQITLKVTDTGVGIPAHLISTITEPFARSNNNPHVADPGWGLGLSITKALVELHGGFLEIFSEEDKGTTVAAVFPNNDSPDVE